jgi:UDP-N-acetyl-D-glucosamine dehydrogenase
MTEITSAASTGEQFPLPTQQDEVAEIQRLQALVAEHRAQGHEIVVVLGVGFVGTVMAGVIADSVDKTTGKQSKFVIGMQPAEYFV